MSNKENLINNVCCPTTENLTKKTFNNTNNKSKKILLSNRIISQTQTGGGILRYGNFGALLNGKARNNRAIKSIITNIKNKEKTNINFDNYIYIDNIINAYSAIKCLYGDKSTLYNYNEFYENFKELQILLKNNNTYQDYCPKGNRYF